MSMLNFIGRGSAFNTEEGNNSAYFVHEGELILIDCGSNIFDRLKASRMLDVFKRVRVIITHTHPDHIGSLGDLIFYNYFKMGTMGEKDIHVYAPYTLKLGKILQLMGVTTDYYHLHQFDNNETMSFTHSNIRLTAVPTRHVDELVTYGYLIDRLGTTIYYSGDANRIPHYIMEMLDNDVIDEFYQDTCAAHYEGNVHLSLHNLALAITSPEIRKKVYCMHLDEGFPIEKVQLMGYNVVEVS
ncbi:metal-dependent hydrolase [Bacillus phage Bastille]|uniref:Metal-dependent hydrolase n=1 Tax=Bacillus phage Bastille TaxID=57477 RepID=J9PKL8_9CAUD|nr:metal-dependent hydrolase [Bacillus phage Bastille]AEQ34349.1 metal-dependent hydrolase [Bacillus phage Bastille]